MNALVIDTSRVADSDFYIVFRARGKLYLMDDGRRYPGDWCRATIHRTSLGVAAELLRELKCCECGGILCDCLPF